jgi:hypothetical protein
MGKLFEHERPKAYQGYDNQAYECDEGKEKPAADTQPMVHFLNSLLA